MKTMTFISIWNQLLTRHSRTAVSLACRISVYLPFCMFIYFRRYWWHHECKFKIGCSKWSKFICDLCDSEGIHRFSNNTRQHGSVITVYHDWGKNVLLFMQRQNVFLFSWNMSAQKALIWEFPESFWNFVFFLERAVLNRTIVMVQDMMTLIYSKTIQIYETFTINCGVKFIVDNR